MTRMSFAANVRAGAAMALAAAIGGAPATVLAQSDAVTLRAEMDLVIIVAPCSWDVPGHPINGERCTGIRLEVTAPAA